MKRKFLGLFITLCLILSVAYVPQIDSQAADVEINYAKLLQESLYFYDANMCGPKVSERSAFSWRGNCHSGDQSVNINGYNVNVSGGFHDAGDHLKAGLPQGYTATMLGIAYLEYQQAFKDTYSEAHLKTITNHFCEYFENCTVLKSDGSVAFFVYMVSDGDEDHKVWCAPESQNAVRHVYYTSDTNPATDEVSEAAAALALQYINFKDTKALDYSKKLFNYAMTHSGGCAKWGLEDSSTGSLLYDSQSWGDDYALAAALLYKATGDSVYKTEFDNTRNASSGGYNIYSWHSWDNVSALADYYGAGNSQALLTCANNMYNGMNKDGGYGCLLQWGSARYNCNTQFLGLLYDKVSGSSEYSSWATSQMNYLLGNNSQNNCYVIGYNSYSVKYPHHRAASASNDASQISADKHTLLGALVGGPKDSYGSYSDQQNDYVCNEVALDYNAGLVCSAAALYTLHKSDGVSTNKLMTANDITVAGAEMRFTYNKSGGTSPGTSGLDGGSADGGSSSKPSNEWINGKWYDVNGNNSYKPTGSWKGNASGWWFEDTSGWYPASCWQKIDHKWYYFDSLGYMASNEWREGYWLSNNGACEYAGVASWHNGSGGWWYEDNTGWYAYSQWQKIDGSWYYFNSSGYMVTSVYIDGYWIGADGVCQ